MIKNDEIKKDIEELIELGNQLWKALRYSDASNEHFRDESDGYPFFLRNYEPWYSKSFAIVKVILPDRLHDFVKWYKDDKRKSISNENYCICDALRGIADFSYKPKDAFMPVYQQVGILRSCVDSFDSKLYDIKAIVQADLFDSELDSAKHLRDKGFLRASGAICGVIIEKHLSQICESRKIVLRKKDPGIGDYNDLLKDNAYGTIEWRRIQHLSDIRNLCDHKKDREPTKEDLNDLIAGTEWLTKNIF